MTIIYIPNLLLLILTISLVSLFETSTSDHHVTHQSAEPSSIGFDLENSHKLQKIILLDQGQPPGDHHDHLVQNELIKSDNILQIVEDDDNHNNNNKKGNDLKEVEDYNEPSSFQPPWDIEPLLVPYGGNEICKQQTEFYIKDLKKWKKWALQMWDATGKLNSGLFSGNSNQLGDFDSCLNIKGPKGFQPNYCLAAIDLILTNEAPLVIKEIVTKIRGDNFIQSYRNEPGHFVPKFSTIGWGICIPKSCSKESLELGLQYSLQSLNSTPGLIVQTAIPKYSCHEETDSLPVATILTMLFFAFVFFISTLATVLDLLNTGRDWSYRLGIENRLIMAFSLKRGIKDLLADSKDEFKCINGIRALCALTLYLAHRLIPLAAILFTNRTYLTENCKKSWSSLLRASNMYTDSFLLISGILTSYNLTKEIVTKGYIKWPTRILARYIRLTPPLLAVVLYYAYIMEHTGSGPQWGTIVTANADLCKSGLWKNILYVQNFFKFEEMCALHTHQLALDMQMYILSPALVYILHSEQITGMILIIMIALGSAVLKFYTVYVNNLSMYFHYGVTLENLYKNANLSYGQTIHRIVPYLIGISFGYFLYKFRKTIYISTKGAVLGWIICTMGIFYSIFSQASLTGKDHKYDPIDAGFYAAIAPFAWSTSVCWVIFMCCTHRGGPIEKFLESRYLLIISRISFSFYLTQFIAFHYNSGIIRATQEARIADIVPLWELAFVFIMSIILTLTFDLPMQEIKNIVLTGGVKKAKKPD